MKEYPIEKIKEIIRGYWSEMMSELDDYVNTDYLDINIKLKYEEFDDGFKLEYKGVKY